MSDLRQMKEWGQWMESINWQVLEIKNQDGGMVLGFLKKMPLVPISFLKIQRFDSQIDFEDLAKAKKEHGVVYSVVEPSSPNLVEEIMTNGYTHTKSTYLPSKTRQIDLTKSEAILWGETSQNLRRLVKKVKPKIKKITIEVFFSGWKKWSPVFTLSKGQMLALKKVMGAKMECWAAIADDELVSAIAMVYSKDTAHYLHTWTSEKGRKMGIHYGLTWQTIIDAKKRGKRTYDFEGVYDKRHPLKDWGGFTEFKRRFGGKEVLYPGCFGRWF